MQVFAFQAHEDTTIEFDQITSIIGPSDAGKTSLIRALRWVAHNKPRGDGFVREGAKEGRARVRIDGETVTRIRRGASKNLYKINGQELKAFGSDAPQQVSDLFRTDDVNFQLQMDPPFWLSLTPGEAAKELNSVADLGVIDDAMAFVASNLRKMGPKEELAQETLRKAEEKVESLGFVESLSKDLDKVLDKKQESEGLSEDLVDLEGDLADMKRSWDRMHGLREFVEDLEETCGLAKTWGKIKDNRSKLENATTSLQDSQKEAEREYPDLPEEEKDRYEQTEALVWDLEDRLREYKSAVSKKDEASLFVTELSAKIEKESEGKCPLCGGELHD